LSTTTITRRDDGVARLSIHSGRGNPVTPALVADLHTSLDALAADPPRALVFDAAGARIFSGGFALPIIAPYDRAQLSAYFDGFMGAMGKLLLLECPTLAAVAGHAIAGGFIMTLACDLRVVQTGRIKLGLSEVDLGVGVPAGAQALLRARVGFQTALKLAMEATLFGPDEALALGYADALAEDAEAAALARAAALAAKPGSGATVARRLANRGLIRRVRAADAAAREDFHDSWFSPEAQAAIAALAAKLSGR